MRLGLLWERKTDFPYESDDPAELNSELLSQFEEDDLLSGLLDGGFDVVRIGDARKLLNRAGYWRSRCDLVFNLSVGYRGVERKLFAAAVLEVARIPYVGSTPYVLALARHKFHAKIIAQAAGVLTPPAALYVGSPVDLSLLRFPVIVKPLAESSSLGVSADAVVRTEAAALARAEYVRRVFRQPAVIESFVAGCEIEVPLLIDPEPRALGVRAIYRAGEVVQDDDFLSADNVYVDDYQFGAPPLYVDEGRVVRTAEHLTAALGIRDFGRIDRLEP